MLSNKEEQQLKLGLKQGFVDKIDYNNAMQKVIDDGIKNKYMKKQQTLF